MKKTILTFLAVFCITLFASAQDKQTEKNKALYYAILINNIDGVSKLLKDSADVNYIVATNGPELKVSMLIAAVNKISINMVKTILLYKPDIHFKDGFNSTAIMYAAATGSRAMVELLLKNGADIHDNDGRGNTVLTAAKESGNDLLIKFVKEKLK